MFVSSFWLACLGAEVWAGSEFPMLDVPAGRAGAVRISEAIIWLQPANSQIQLKIRAILNQGTFIAYISSSFLRMRKYTCFLDVSAIE
jgi:hypothetical protein